MEFERALFRVYDRSLESIQLDSPWFGNARPSVILKWSQKILMIVALGMIVLTATLHTTFVEQPGCLKQKLETYHQNLLAINPNATGELLPKDVILRLAISQYADPAELVPSPSEQTASVIPETKNVTRLSTNTLATDPTQNGPGKTEFDAKYEFSVSFPLMLMDGDLRSKLGVRELNITLEHTCFGATPFDRFLVLATGHDTPVINMLMFSLHSGGLLKNMFTKEEWSWGKGELPPAGGYSPLLRLALKPLALLSSLLAFFLMSSVTALIVRVLISSGVVFMFPLFSALERAGLRGFNQRLLRLSYPWLGAPMEELQRRGKWWCTTRCTRRRRWPGRSGSTASPPRPAWRSGSSGA